MRLFLLLAAIPIIEIALFIEIGGWLGTWPTIGIVILTALAGSMLLRRQGIAVLGQVQQRLARGENPGQLLAEGAMILVAGVLLLTPGFFTDAVGFALLVPPVRNALWAAASRRMQVVSVSSGNAARQDRPARDQTVDGTWREADPDPDRPVPPDARGIGDGS